MQNLSGLDKARSLERNSQDAVRAVLAAEDRLVASDWPQVGGRDLFDAR